MHWLPSKYGLLEGQLERLEIGAGSAPIKLVAAGFEFLMTVTPLLVSH